MGEYRLTKNDVLAVKQFDDQIGLCGAPLEDHHDGADTAWIYLTDSQCVGIPWATLVPRGAENLIEHILTMKNRTPFPVAVILAVFSLGVAASNPALGDLKLEGTITAQPVLWQGSQFY